MSIRPARSTDDAVLVALERRCWSPLADVVSARPPGVPFFGPSHEPADVLVALRQGVLIGWVQVGRPTALESNAHVQQLQGLGVHPDARGEGAGRALVLAALDLARSRAARKVCLRVLRTNEPAQALYRSLGFVEEGVLVEEFFLEGRWVDDLLMARLEPGRDQSDPAGG